MRAEGDTWSAESAHKGSHSCLGGVTYALIKPVHNMTLVARSVVVRRVAYRHGAQTGSQFLRTNA